MASNKSSSQTTSSQQNIQPEEGSPRSQDEKQIRGRSENGTQRVQQGAGDSVGEATEEA